MLGPGHEKMQIGVTIALTIATPAACATLGVPIREAALVCFAATVGGLLSIIFTPDLIDVDGDTLPEARIRAVPGAGWLLAGVYDLVSWAIPHRGISHVPFVGTAISVAPLIFIWLPVLFLGGGKFVILAFLFKSLADLGHIITDPIWTMLKRKGWRP